MDFRELQYVLKVSEERSFSKAAQKLFIAQPSLSQYIQKVEQELGVQLFDRSSNPIKPTFAGELYIEIAKRILDLKDQLYQQMEDIANFKKGRLTIGLSPFRSTYIMPKVLPFFHEKFPGIEVILLEGTSSELEDLAIKGRTDISLMTLPVDESIFAYKSIITEEILIAIPPNHSMKKDLEQDIPSDHQRPSIKLSQLRNEPFILLKQNQKLHKIAIDMCGEAGFKPRVILESESIEAAHALVTAGMGVTFIPDTLPLFRELPQHPLYFSIDELRPTRELVIAYRKVRYLSAAANEFIDNIKCILSPFKNNMI